jgi:hypothetical protein
VLEFGSIVLAVTLLAGTWMISRRVRLGWLYLCGMQLPAGAYDIVTRQYGFVAVSLVGGWLYWRGWQIRGSKNLILGDSESDCPLTVAYGYCPHCEHPAKGN